MLRNAVWVLRQRRYAALAVFMIALAGFCAFAGTWQISRYTQKVRDNDALRANAHAAAAPLTPALLPLTGSAPDPNAEQIRFRTVSVTGSYLPVTQQYLRNQTIGDVDGFVVISPLRTAGGVLLVGRGFVAPAADGGPPTGIAAPPAGTVRITGRLETPSSSADHAGALPDHIIDTVNPAEQAARLHAPVYAGYVDLDPDQPGGSGLQALPPPDLSNPAGGAAEWQHLAYIVQWYIFAGLALAAPFAVCAHEVREARKRFLGIDPAAVEFGADALEALPGGQSPPLAGGGALVPRPGALPAERSAVDAARVERATRLADRYGRSLGRQLPSGPLPAPPPPPTTPRRRGIGHDYRPATSATRPAPALDDYHGSYNDYLWQLALADGDIPDVSLPEAASEPGADPPGVLPAPHVIDTSND